MPLSQEQLMRLLAGVDLPNSDAVYGPDPTDASDPGQQYLQTFGQDYLDPALQNAQATGVYDQKPQYQSDDIFARQKFYAGLAQDQGKAGYEMGQDVLKNTRAEKQLAMDQATFNDVHGDPTAQMRVLMAKGMTPQSIVNAYEGATSPDDFEAQMKAIDDALGETDQNGTPVTVHTQGGMAARERLYQQARQMSMTQQADESDALMGERWKGLGMQQRAKEIFLRQQNPTRNVAVSRFGDAFYGEDAEQQARDAAEVKAKAQAKPQGKKMSYMEWDKETRQKGTDKRLQSKGVGNPGTVLQTKIPVSGGMRFGA